MASGVSKQFPQPTSRTLQSFPLREAGFIFQIQGWYELSLEGRFLYPKEHSFRKAVFKGHFFFKFTFDSFKRHLGDFPGGPVAKTPQSQGQGPGFNPWLGN